jgi:hypothetical protein
VRQRRQKKNKRRYDAVSRGTSGTLRGGPLVSRPRSSSVAMPRGGTRQRQFALALLPAGLDLRLPALPRVRFSWRLSSLAMVVLLGVMLVRLVSDRRMYITGVNLGGSVLVPGQEIYAAAGIAGQHIFWVDPAEVQRRIAAVPGVASARVSVQWPAMVTIVVSERIPVVSWVEGQQTWWVDVDGQKFQARTDLPGLLPISVDDAAAGDVGKIAPPAAVAGALELRQLRPNIELLHYDAQHGLSYADGRGWRGYFGVGGDMPQKLAVYEKLVTDLLARGIQPKTISVEAYQAPYYTK